MTTRVTRFIRANAIALVALFIALSGAAYAASKVNSHAVKDNSLKSRDLKNGKAVSGVDVVGDSLGGAQIDESRLSGVSPAGAAGGDLTGSYPNPQLDPSKLIPAGPAGGDLAGSYPNPTLAAGSAASVGLHDSGVVTGAIGSAPQSMLTVGPFSFTENCGNAAPGASTRIILTTTRDNSAYSQTSISQASPYTVGDDDLDSNEAPAVVTYNRSTDSATVYQISVATPDGALITGTIDAAVRVVGPNVQCVSRVRVYG